MSTEIHLKRENDRLRREIAELKAQIAELEVRLPKQAEASKDKASAPAKGYDPFNPVPGDVVVNMMRQKQRQKRRSWLE